MSTDIMFRAFLSASFIVFASMSCGGIADAYVFKVGGSEGWRVPLTNETGLYGQWAARNRFQIGDSLAFESRNGLVFSVDKYGFYHCNTSNPIFVYKNITTVTVTLEHPGLFYFITGDKTDCKNGQRVIVDVLTPHQHRHAGDIHQSPPPYIALAPRSYWTTTSMDSPAPLPRPSTSGSFHVSASLGSVLITAFIAGIVLMFYLVV